MKLVSDFIEVNTTGYTHMVDITEDVTAIIEKNGIKNGTAILFCVGSTCALTTIEFEPGLVNKDFPEVMEKIAPYKHDYAHHHMWRDDNGAAHLRASLVGPSLTIPIINGKLACGTWQQIVLIDFDTRARTRKIVVQIWHD